jgi:hypothetical protein
LPYVPEDKSSVTEKDKPLARFTNSLEETCLYRLPGNLLPGTARPTTFSATYPRIPGRHRPLAEPEGYPYIVRS